MSILSLLCDYIQFRESGARLRVHREVIPHASILTLPSGAYPICPLPGPGRQYLPISFHVAVNAVAGAYTNVDAGAYAQIIGAQDWITPYVANDATFETCDTPSAAGGASALTQMTLLFATAGKQAALLPALMRPDCSATQWWALAQMTTDYAAALNQAFYLAVDNGGSGNFTGGNAANEMIVTSVFVEHRLS